MSGAAASKARIWLLAIRPKTLPAAVGPVFVGSAFAYKHGEFAPLPAMAAVFGAILLQIAANLANDYFDFLKGYDIEERVGPQRVAASGLLSTSELKTGLGINILLAMLIGLYLVYVGGWPILVIGILSIIFAVVYSGGPFPLTSNGLGDVFVFIFFGLVAVNGTYYVQALNLNEEAILGSVPVGLLITAILVVNNYRDIETDRKTGKNTLAVMMGQSYTRMYYVILLVISYLVPFYLLTMGNPIWILLPLLSVPLAIKQSRILYQSTDGANLNLALAGTAQLSLFYSVLFSIGIVL